MLGRNVSVPEPTTVNVVTTEVLISPLEGVTEPAVVWIVSVEPQLSGFSSSATAHTERTGSGNTTVKVDPTLAVRYATGLLGTGESHVAKSLLLNAGVPPAEALGAVATRPSIAPAPTTRGMESRVSRRIGRVYVREGKNCHSFAGHAVTLDLVGG